MPRHDVFHFGLTGFAELEKALDELPRALARTTLQRILVRAAQPIAARARALVEEDDGDLKESITVSTKLKDSQKSDGAGRNVMTAKGWRRQAAPVVVYVGPTQPHGSLVEWGTGPRHHRNGKFVGVMPARPFLRPAWDAGRHDALASIGRDAWTELAKTAKRLAKKAEAGRLGRSARRHLGGW